MQQTNPKLAKAVEPEDWSDKFPTKAACPTCDGSGKIPESNPQGSYDHKTCWKCKGTGQEEAAAAPRRFKEPICRHAGVVSQQECPYCEEEAAEPRADGKDEYTVTRRWLQKLRDCLKYSFEPGANLPVAIGMVDHALEGCGPPDDVCPVSRQDCHRWANKLSMSPEDVVLLLQLAAWLERGRV